MSVKCLRSVASFDHGALSEGPRISTRWGNVAALVDQFGPSDYAPRASLLAEFAVGDLESRAMVGPVLLGNCRLRRHRTRASILASSTAGGADLFVQRRGRSGLGIVRGGIVRFDPVVHERIEGGTLRAMYLKKILPGASDRTSGGPPRCLAESHRFVMTWV